MAHRIHLALNVADVGKSVAFYRRLLGAEPDKHSEAFAKFEPADTAINVALIRAETVPVPAAREPKKGELNHLGLQVRSAEEVRAAERHMREAGLDPIPDRSLSGEERILLYDPDGNEWEVFYATAISAKSAPAAEEDRSANRQQQPASPVHD